MELNIIKKFGKDYLQFDNVEEIVFKNFGGDGNGRGDIKGEFGIKLNNYPEIVERLQESKNKFGIPWNVKTWVPKDDSEPVTYLTVKVSVKNEDSLVLVINRQGRNIELPATEIGCLDSMPIESCDIDIRAYDDEYRGEPFRSAYLDGIYVRSGASRFKDRLAAEEHPEE